MVKMKPLTSSGGNITLNGITFDLPSYEYDILKVNIVKTSDSEIGHTFNEFGQNTEHQNVDVDFISIGDTSSLNQDVLDILTNSNLGVSVISDIKYSRILSSSKLSTIGGTFHNSNPKEIKEFTFNIGTTIVPEYKLYTDTLRTCTATVYMHRPLFGDPYLSIMSGPVSQEYVRPAGVDICNYNIHREFTVTIEVYTTVQSTAELTEIILHYKKNGCYGGRISVFNCFDPFLYYGKTKAYFIHNVIEKHSTVGFCKIQDIKHGCPKNRAVWYEVIKGIKPDSVIDPFMGSGTTAEVCTKLGIPWIGYEINEIYKQDIEKRLKGSVKEPEQINLLKFVVH